MLDSCRELPSGRRAAGPCPRSPFLSIRNRALMAHSMIDGTNTTPITVNVCTLQMKHRFLSDRAETVVERMRIKDKSNQLRRFHIGHGSF